MIYSQPLKHGEIIQVVPADPAAGADLSYLLPNNYTYRILNLSFTYVCDGNAANRYFTLTITNAGVRALWTVNNVPSTLGQTSIVNIAEWAEPATATAVGVRLVPLPRELIIPGNYTLATAINGIQVGDQISLVSIWLQRWVNQTV